MKESNAVLLDAIHTAEMLGVHRATVFKLNASGKMPRPVKLGRATRWWRDELLEWVGAGCPPRSKWEARNAAPIRKIR